MVSNRRWPSFACVWAALAVSRPLVCAAAAPDDSRLAFSASSASSEERQATALDDTAPPSGPCRGCVQVFYRGLNGSSCYRIPTIIKTHTGALLAVAENRHHSCKDDAGRHDLVLRRSTDGGSTWGPLILIWEGQSPCPGCPAAVSNPNLVEVNFHNGSYAVLLHFDTLNNPTAERHGLDMEIWSYDDGLTWLKPSVLRIPPFANKGGLIGPSVGIQAASGTIYFSALGNQPNVTQLLYFSHDFGLTWNASVHMPSHGSESSIAFLVNSSDERIIMSLRHIKHRAQLLWSADHIPQAITYPPGLADPGCQGSIVNQDGVLHLSNPNHDKHRLNMTVKSSYDQGKTWSSGIQIWPRASAYSQLVPLGSKRLGLLFEAGVGSKKAYDMISFVVVDVDRQIVVDLPAATTAKVAGERGEAAMLEDAWQAVNI